MTIGIPPGNILQNLYLSERCKVYKEEGLKTFLEVGTGKGYVASTLLSQGLEGIGLDLNKEAVNYNREINKKFIEEGKYNVICEDFWNYSPANKFDIIISSMVIEHFDDSKVLEYFEKGKSLLSDNSNARIISFVPASMKYWGMEDEIAGHFRRYEFETVRQLAQKVSMKCIHIAGLTYPLSNWLYGLSNKIVETNERDKMKLSKKERTIYTGNREVLYKTTFPKIFNLVLNPIVLYPFHLLQKMNLKNKNSMVIFVEMKR